MIPHKGYWTLLTCLSHRLVSIIWFTSSWQDKMGSQGLVSKRTDYHNDLFVYSCLLIALTTLTSWDMETSNSTVTGSDTFSTGRMNWLYLLNSLRNNLSSAFDEKLPDETEKKKCKTLKILRLQKKPLHDPPSGKRLYINLWIIYRQTMYCST